MWNKSVIGIAIMTITMGQAEAARISDITNTRHNLSSLSSNTVKATSEKQLCVFCHTPHAAEEIPRAPLWNRKLSGATYTLYSSTSLDATDLKQPGALANTAGGSKLCLSCHDGTLAIGAVNVLNGKSISQPVAMQGTDAGGVMAPGAGKTSGFTRNLGTDLSNDHPIAFTYNTALAILDGDLRDPASSSVIANRKVGVKPAIPLFENQVECISCHDPHVRDTVDGNIKFLRLNRFQSLLGEPKAGKFSPENDIICLGCHSKEGWEGSAHASSIVADETYSTSGATLRDFPTSPQPLPVWRAACLNCHDTHTVTGSRRLLREGTDSTTKPKTAGSAAIEETCYQCHSNDGDTLSSQGYGTQVPNIKSDFKLPRHMPIANNEQAYGYEVHNIGTQNDQAPTQRGKDFIESQLLLGKGDLMNRHAECTDCHNPHRVAKNRLFNGNLGMPNEAGTHSHQEPHTNIASGVLRGTWGVEPMAYEGNAFLSIPLTFQIKKGLAAQDAPTLVTQSYVTREYQVCLKCHSNYAYNDNKLYPNGGRPQLGYPGGTPSGTNGLTEYTNQAMEFQAPNSHMGETTTTDSGAWTATFNCGEDFCPSNLSSNNHRSWHPIMAPTGRTKAVRRMNLPGVFYPPWDNYVGTQTMYCSDCHGSGVSGYGSAVPDGGENGNPWGPHGSTKDFLLKGKWDKYTGTPCGNGDSFQSSPDFNEGNVQEIGDCKSGSPDPRLDQREDICFKCHERTNYAFQSDTHGEGMSGFSRQPLSANLHLKHLGRLHRMKCSWCHAAVPHGWKNKALLVNLNDVGPEAGLPPGTEITDKTDGSGKAVLYTGPPYYNNAILKILRFVPSGEWDPKVCGSRSGPTGQAWMTTTCNNLP